MQTVKVIFEVSTNKNGSAIQEEKEFQFDDDETQEEIEGQIDVCLIEWVYQNINASFKIIS